MGRKRPPTPRPALFDAAALQSFIVAHGNSRAAAARAVPVVYRAAMRALREVSAQVAEMGGRQADGVVDEKRVVCDLCAEDAAARWVDATRSQLVRRRELKAGLADAIADKVNAKLGARTRARLSTLDLSPTTPHGQLVLVAICPAPSAPLSWSFCRRNFYRARTGGPRQLDCPLCGFVRSHCTYFVYSPCDSCPCLSRARLAPCSKDGGTSKLLLETHDGL